MILVYNVKSTAYSVHIKQWFEWQARNCNTMQIITLIGITWRKSSTTKDGHNTGRHDHGTKCVHCLGGKKEEIIQC